MLSRRSFFIGATAAIITAPAIVRVASIMPVKRFPSVSMRSIADYWPDDDTVRRLDVLYGQLRTKLAEAVINGSAEIDYGGGYAETILNPLLTSQQIFTPEPRHGLVKYLTKV